MDPSYLIQKRINPSHQLSIISDTPINFRKSTKFSNINVQLEPIMDRFENYSTKFFRLEKISIKLNSFIIQNAIFGSQK
jgi:hypothetical protein